ncbi:MAG: dihydropteroate synthase [Syntrophales bacterium]
MDINARLLCVTSLPEAVEELKRIGVEPYGIESMAPKMMHVCIILDSIECRVANIIKQDMLSLGGDAAVSRGSIDCSVPRTDAIIIGTFKQVERFAQKLALQPFGLKKLSEDIRKILVDIHNRNFLIRTSRRTIRIGRRTLVMGILNMTPDSFSDGGRLHSTDEGVRQAMRMAEDGADIIDIGGESSRPGSEGVPLEVELERVIPLIEALSGLIQVPVSIDTTKAEVARRAIEAGAEIINDISAMTADGRMTEVAVHYGAPVILMHMRGIPRTMQEGDLRYASLRGEIISYLRSRMEDAVSRGVEPDKFIVDPGIGFGKDVSDNLKIIKYLKEFKTLGRPILVGPSRKGFTGRITGVDIPQERLEGTAAAITAAIINGADIVRVHDVKFMKRVSMMADAIARA